MEAHYGAGPHIAENGEQHHGGSRVGVVTGVEIVGQAGAVADTGREPADQRGHPLGRGQPEPGPDRAGELARSRAAHPAISVCAACSSMPQMSRWCWVWLPSSVAAAQNAAGHPGIPLKPAADRQDREARAGPLGRGQHILRKPYRPCAVEGQRPTCGRSRGPWRTSAGSRAGGAGFPGGRGRDGPGTRRRRCPGDRLRGCPFGLPGAADHGSQGGGGPQAQNGAPPMERSYRVIRGRGGAGLRGAVAVLQRKTPVCPSE